MLDGAYKTSNETSNVRVVEVIFLTHTAPCAPVAKLLTAYTGLLLSDENALTATGVYPLGVLILSAVAVAYPYVFAPQVMLAV